MKIADRPQGVIPRDYRMDNVLFHFKEELGRDAVPRKRS